MSAHQGKAITDGMADTKGVKYTLDWVSGWATYSMELMVQKDMLHWDGVSEIALQFRLWVVFHMLIVSIMTEVARKNWCLALIVHLEPYKNCYLFAGNAFEKFSMNSKTLRKL